jgi:acetyl-CoA acetyltransferase
LLQLVLGFRHAQGTAPEPDKPTGPMPFWPRRAAAPMRRVALVGAGMSDFGNRPGMTPARLFAEAHERMLASIDGAWDGCVDEAWIGSVGFGGHQPGNSAALYLAQTATRGAPAHRVENACASSGFALRNAVHAVRSGDVSVALVGGVESMTPFSRAHRGYWLGVSGDTEVERMAGLTFPGVYAMMARAHMESHGTTPEHLARVAVKNHRNGARNPHAQFQKEISLDKALAAARVADPLGLFDCCSVTDGAACALVVCEDVAARFTDRPVWIEGSGGATDTLALHDRVSLTAMPATVQAAKQAYAQSGLRPADVDMAEVHDCFTIAEIMATEDLGFFPKGKGGPAAADGRTDHGGDIVVNPSGGLKAKGHPLGATGAGQLVEVFAQLRGEAGARQVKHAQTALAHNVGGSGATCTVHVFRGSA